MRNILAVALLGALAVTSLSAALSTSEARRIEDAAAVLRELHAAPDQDVPLDLWEKASCVMVIPGLKKAAFIVGGEYGKGLMSCRRNGAWSPPVFMRLGKGSWGLQFGAQTIDLVLLVMNDKGIEKLLNNRVSLGAEASVAAGPVGRDARAATDVQLQAEILSYSRTQGVFAGVNLSGGVLRDDNDDNADLYGKGISEKSILLEGRVQLPGIARPFNEALSR
jgi:lipid-binding SYLF domain-containing protein